MSVAYIINSTSVLISPLIVALFFDEPTTFTYWIASWLALVSLLLVIQPSFLFGQTDIIKYTEYEYAYVGYMLVICT